MRKENDLNIVSLEWASKILGAHLEIKNVVGEMVAFFKGSVPLKNVRLLLWDNVKRRFYLEITGSGRYIDEPKVTSDIVKGVYAKEPLVLKSAVLIPLLERNNFLGVLVTTDRSLFFKYKEESIRAASMMAVALANIRLLVESEMRTQDMFRFNVLSRALNPTVHEEEIVRILLEGLLGIIKYDIAGLLVIGKNSQRIFIRSVKPASEGALKAVRNNLFKLTTDLIKNQLDEKKIQVIRHVPRGKAPALKINSYLDAPLITKGKFLGVLNLCSYEKDNFSARDAQNISTLVAHGAVAFENAMLYQDLRRTYFSIIKALTSAIEAKDEYTRGHSELVSKFSKAIASEMGMSPSMIEYIQIAGLLHDLGKIGVPEEILVKKGKLTDNEYGVVKAHPDIAMKILGPVEFPHFDLGAEIKEGAKGKELIRTESPPEATLHLFEEADLSSEVKLMIYHHHEKYSGGGYPSGLKKDEIPLGARILSVADTFEALTANRPYRKAFSTEEAVKILRQISGEQLDPKITEVFINLVKQKGIERLKAQAEI